MKVAVISDIHANLAAFEKVLEDIERQGIRDIYCLGDIIGYGPDPRACIELARGLKVNLLGNHEEAVLFGAIGFNPKAKAAIDWTREQLLLDTEPEEKNRELWDFLQSLDREYREGDVLFVHGSPRDPTREYVFRQDHQNRGKMDEIFASPKDFAWRVCFTGHTHHPGVFTQDTPYKFYDPRELGGRFPLAQAPGRVLVNVGSVGQPRDGDWRASYVIYDGEEIVFRRVDYDIHRTLARFQSCPALPGYLARRLAEGK